MINNIKRNGILLIDKIKKGKYVYFIMENGERLSGDEFINGIEFEIQCNKLQIWIKNKCFQGVWLKKEYISQKWHSSGENNPFYGKIPTEEHREKISQKNKGKYNGDKNPMFGRSIVDIWKNKYGAEKTEEIKYNWALKLSDANLGEKNPMSGIGLFKLWENRYGIEEANSRQNSLLEKRRKTLSSPKMKKKISDNAKRVDKRFKERDIEKYILNKKKAAMASHESQKKYKKNNIEIKVENWLIEHNIKNEWSPIMGSYQFDFIIKGKRILIEVNGDYWHVNPRVYGNMLFKDLRNYQKNKIIIDLKKKIYAHERNFKVLTIWEYDIVRDNFDALKELI